MRFLFLLHALLFAFIGVAAGRMHYIKKHPNYDCGKGTQWKAPYDTECGEYCITREMQCCNAGLGHFCRKTDTCNFPLRSCCPGAVCYDKCLPKGSDCCAEGLVYCLPNATCAKKRKQDICILKKEMFRLQHDSGPRHDGKHCSGTMCGGQCLPEGSRCCGYGLGYCAADQRCWKDPKEKRWMCLAESEVHLKRLDSHSGHRDTDVPEHEDFDVKDPPEPEPEKPKSKEDSKEAES